MAMRLSGLASGMDTESIIKQLMTAKSLKKTKLEQSKTTLEWKKEKWGELNTKLMNLFSKQVSKMRMQGAYNAKAAASSNESVASIKADTTATVGSYTMSVSKVATSQYLTSAKLDSTRVEGGKITQDTKLSEIDPSLENSEISIVNGDKKVNFQVRSDSTIKDYVDALKSAGLNASYDEAQARFFISGKESGVQNTFSITTNKLSGDELNARSAIESALGYSGMSNESKNIVNNVYLSLSSFSGTAEEKEGAVASAIQTLTDVGHAKQTADITNAATQTLKAQLYNENYTEIYNEQEKKYYNTDENGNITSIKDEFANKFGDQYDIMTPEDKERVGVSTKEEFIKKSVDILAAKDAKEATASKVNSLISSDEATKERLEELKLTGLSDTSGFSQEQIEEYNLKSFAGTNVMTREALESTLTDLVKNYANNEDRSSATNGSALNALGMTDIVVDSEGAKTVGGTPTGMALISAGDSKITLNGAELTSSSSSVTVNGLTIELKKQTAENESITFSVSNDTSGIYDNIKTFVKEYNDIVQEMSKLFNAPNAKGYQPLTEEEKKEMSTSQVDLWESKIKDSLLRRDDQLGSLMTGMRTALSSSIEVDGKKYSLASFGITTSNIISENGILHIMGDPDDTAYSSMAEKLKTALAEDPDTVAKAFSGIVTKLYDTMNKSMASTKVSSAFTFYNDKKMTDDVKDYASRIKTLSVRLQRQEDAYYKQFSALEAAMSRMNSQTSSMSAMFGGN